MGRTLALNTEQLLPRPADLGAQRGSDAHRGPLLVITVCLSRALALRARMK